MIEGIMDHQFHSQEHYLMRDDENVFQESMNAECTHRCNSTCSDEGCNCECGEFHLE